LNRTKAKCHEEEKKSVSLFSDLMSIVWFEKYCMNKLEKKIAHKCCINLASQSILIDFWKEKNLQQNKTDFFFVNVQRTRTIEERRRRSKLNWHIKLGLRSSRKIEHENEAHSGKKKRNKNYEKHSLWQSSLQRGIEIKMHVIHYGVSQRLKTNQNQNYYV
jgi:hypothetical protein